MTTSPDKTATEARLKLVARRSVIDRSQRHNETDGAALRGETREHASNEEIAEVLVAMSDRERLEVDAIDAALSRIDLGTWGKCSSCGKKIAANRLTAMPEAHHCLACASAAGPIRG